MSDKLHIPTTADLWQRMAEMETWLRYFRRSANNYIPADKLEEVDKFLKP